jgi:hypothetical protein
MLGAVGYVAGLAAMASPRHCVWQAIAWSQVKSVTPMRIVCVRHS